MRVVALREEVVPLGLSLGLLAPERLHGGSRGAGPVREPQLKEVDPLEEKVNVVDCVYVHQHIKYGFEHHFY